MTPEELDKLEAKVGYILGHIGASADGRLPTLTTFEPWEVESCLAAIPNLIEEIRKYRRWRRDVYVNVRAALGNLDEE